jgi:hypothetical protein
MPSPFDLSMNTRPSARAAVLAFAMNVVPVVPVDIFRFLRVPAIVWVLRKEKERGRKCRERHLKLHRRGM